MHEVRRLEQRERPEQRRLGRRSNRGPAARRRARRRRLWSPRSRPTRRARSAAMATIRANANPASTRLSNGRRSLVRSPKSIPPVTKPTAPAHAANALTAANPARQGRRAVGCLDAFASGFSLVPDRPSLLAGCAVDTSDRTAAAAERSLTSRGASFDSWCQCPFTSSTRLRLHPCRSGVPSHVALLSVGALGPIVTHTDLDHDRDASTGSHNVVGRAHRMRSAELGRRPPPRRWARDRAVAWSGSGEDEWGATTPCAVRCPRSGSSTGNGGRSAGRQ